MVTELDVSLPGKFKPVIEKYGKMVTFVTYPDRVENNSDSSVNLGTPVSYSLKVSPPNDVMVKLSSDGTGVEESAQEIVLLTGNGTDWPIAFVPEIGMPVQFDSKSPLIVRVDELYSGELIVAYHIFLES